MPQWLLLSVTLAGLPPKDAESVIKPPALEPGATIGIVAPASSLDEDSVKRAVRNIQKRGYRVKLSIGYRQRQAYLASDDETRAAEINAFFADPDVDAILCLRGGYGSPRILDRIDYEAARRHPKVFVGYSDITALLIALHRKAGLVTFHGPMAKEFSVGRGLTQYSEKYFWSAFSPRSGDFDDWGRGGPSGRGALTTLVGGRAEGVLVGGNLSVLVSTLGTPYEVSAKDGILFLEEVNEKAFRIDRMLNQLRLSGKLAQLRGVVLGSFSRCGSDLRTTSKTLDDLFIDYFAGLGIPVLMGFPTGHIPDQVVMPVGARVRLDAEAKRLVILESAVAERSGRRDSQESR